MDRERPRASDSEEKIPEAWIGQEVMLETTEALSSDLRAAAPTYLEDVNERGIVVLVTRHKDQSQFSRYFSPWSAGGLDTCCRGGRAGGAASRGFLSPRGARPSGRNGARLPLGGATGRTLALGMAAGEPRVQWGRGIPANGGAGRGGREPHRP